MSKKETKKTPGSKKISNPNHELFCQLYSKGGELFGNATKCYMEAFGIQEKVNEMDEKIREERGVKLAFIMRGRKNTLTNSSRSAAYLLLTNIHIKDRCNFFLDQLFCNVEADRELAFTMKQRGDLNAKVSALKEYNRVQNRVKDIENNSVVNVNIINYAKKKEK